MKAPLLYLIDDDPDDREIFEVALTKVSPTCVLLTAKNGQEALSKFKSNPKFRPGYVFLDLNMPGIHGMECLAEIRKENYIRDIPIIIYSTSSNPVYIADSQELGATHYLIKPAAVTKLTHLISSILEKRDLPFLLKL